MGDISADALPVRREGARPISAYPALQIRNRPSRELEGRPRRDDGLGGRKPKEVSAGQAHFGSKEVMIRSPNKKGRAEQDRKLDLLSGDRTFASGKLIGSCVDPIYHRVGGGETGIQDTSRKAQRS